MVISSTHVRCGVAAAIGFALMTANPAAIVSAIFMPALALSQPTRRASYRAALSYYGAALWPMIPGANNFFGPNASMIAAIGLWGFATAALASVWPLVWSLDRRQAMWRSPLGLLLTVIPPLGIIGFASPLTAAGFLFPRTAWCGLAACAVLSGALAVWPRKAAIALGCLAVAVNVVAFEDPASVAGWQGVNTKFGGIAHGHVNPTTEFQAAQWIQQFSLSANAKVIVFPETVVPTWTAATEAFWQQTIERLRASGRTILIGARVPINNPRGLPQPYDFSADLVALRGDHPHHFRPVYRRSTAFTYDNALVIRGAETGNFVQRIPVPFAMWNPFKSESARLHLSAPTTVPIAGERVAVLVCYEELLTWPVLSSALRHPTVLIAVANDHWITGTPIASFQHAAVRAWSRLFGIPALTATNF